MFHYQRGISFSVISLKCDLRRRKKEKKKNIMENNDEHICLPSKISVKIKLKRVDAKNMHSRAKLIAWRRFCFLFDIRLICKKKIWSLATVNRDASSDTKSHTNYFHKVLFVVFEKSTISFVDREKKTLY